MDSSVPCKRRSKKSQELKEQFGLQKQYILGMFGDGNIGGIKHQYIKIQCNWKKPLKSLEDKCAPGNRLERQRFSLRKRLPVFIERVWNNKEKMPFEDFSLEEVEKNDLKLSKIINDNRQDSILLGFDSDDHYDGMWAD